MSLPELTMEEIEAADSVGVKLEMTEGLPTWEFHPTPRHQLLMQSILKSIRSTRAAGCACLPISDVLVRFPDGSLKRPDISIFCEAPKELDEAVNAVPGAVIEIVSKESRRKDYELNPPFYLKHGVLDVLVIDPIPGDVAWFTKQGRRDLKVPQTISLQCGCEAEI
ncbi:MAG: Uma2 family endonuclease [Fimbriimonas sp.]